MNLADTIVPKSDQINFDDLIAGPITVKVREVKRGPSAEQPVEIVLDGHRPFRPCKSMRRVLIACWGDDGHAWAGRSMTLYGDPSVKFGGVAVGGIRISYLSHIDGDKVLMLTTTRSKRSGYTVRPLALAPAAYPDDKFASNVDAWVKAVRAGKLTVPQLISKASQTGQLTAEQIATIESRVTPSSMLDSLLSAAATATSDDDRAEIIDAARDLSEDERSRIVAAFPAA